jgi:hypothetical protein
MAVVAMMAAAAYALWPRGPRPCLATFEQVRTGMTRDEVIATVGGPPTARGPWPSLQQKLGLTVIRDEWRTEDGLLRVTFGPDDRAEYVEVFALPVKPTRWGRFRAQSGL